MGETRAKREVLNCGYAMFGNRWTKVKVKASASECDRLLKLAPSKEKLIPKE